MVCWRAGRGGGRCPAAAAAGWRRRQAAWRQAGEHQRPRPARVNGCPQAGQAAVSLRVSSRGVVWGWGIVLFLAGGGRDAAEVAVLEPVGVAFEGDDFGVVDETVDHGGGDDVVAEHLAPPAERLVAGHDEAGSLVAG